jgi:ribonuclease P protein component
MQKEIDLLFDEGTSFIAYPLRVVFLHKKPASGVPLAVFISVPKKRFKRAVKRNRIKRLFRESYRLNKNSLCESLVAAGEGLLVACIYVSNELCDFATMEAAVKKVLNRLTPNPLQGA